MALFAHIVVISIIITQCAAVSLQEQLEHVATASRESKVLFVKDFHAGLGAKNNKNIECRRLLQDQDDATTARRFFAPGSSIIGVPSMPSHLPAAEPILPGHTLLRPTLGMLKSAVKFPHRDMENGAGVYGNIDNLGIRYDGINERILYTGFRRVPSNYIMVLPQKRNGDQSVVFIGAPVTVDSERFTPEPRTLIETLENRVETERAMNEFFKKINPDRNRNSKDDSRQALRVGYHEAIKKNTPRKLMFNLVDTDTSSSSAEKPKFKDESTSKEEEPQVEDKKTWFAKTKHAYNHVKISSHAPDIAEYMPVETDDFDDLRNWWFFNQDDFKAFKEFDSEVENSSGPPPAHEKRENK